MPVIRFKFRPEKALAAIHWMVSEQSPIDLHTMLKACYFADKEHLNEHGRPIFGATYQAMRWGPVPLEIYEMAKGEALWLAELGLKRLPWRRDGADLILRSNAEPELSALSRSDIDALRAAHSKSRSMTFSARTAATHGRDWQRADMGIMRYEDMIEDGPGKAAEVERLQETARYMRL